MVLNVPISLLLEHLANPRNKNLDFVTQCTTLHQMNGPQLKIWRTSRDLSMRALAEDYLDRQVTHTTISRWEASPEHIPEWASAKLLGNTQLTLPISELHQLLDIARIEGKNFQQLLADAIRSYLQSQLPGPSIAPRKPTTPPTQASVLNQDPTPYNAPELPTKAKAPNKPSGYFNTEVRQPETKPTNQADL